jgi:hypothetical protein
MLPGNSQFPNPNPPRPPGAPKPIGTINPVKPGVGSKSQDMMKKDMLEKDSLKKQKNGSGVGNKAPMPMKPGIQTKNAPMPYNKGSVKKLGRGF